MTRKDYVLIASGFAAAYTKASGNPEARTAIGNAIVEVGTVLKGDNPRFDTRRFVDACIGSN